MQMHAIVVSVIVGMFLGKMGWLFMVTKRGIDLVEMKLADFGDI
jgi:hypothetical protein